MGKVREYESYAEIGSYLHRNDGEAYVKAYTSVNEPLKVDSSKDSEQISKVRVIMKVEEDRAVKKDGSFYEKTVGMVQERDSATSPTQHAVNPPSSMPRTGPDLSNLNQSNSAPQSAGPSGLAVLKNFVDNHFNLTLAILGISVLALILASIALVK